MDNNDILRKKERNNAFYIKEQTVIDQTTGEILNFSEETIRRTSSEPDFIKVYYETMMAFNQVHDVPVSFVLSLSKFLEWTTDGEPSVVTINKRVKEIMCHDCNLNIRQIERYIKKSVDTGLLFRTSYRGVYEVNPFMIAKGKWDSIKKLRTRFDYVDGIWKRVIEFEMKESMDSQDNDV